MTTPPQALDQLAAVVGEVRDELRHHRREREARRADSAEHRAEMAALRRPLRGLDIRSFARIPGFLALFRRTIPKRAWTGRADGRAEVACPCGAQPRCDVNVPQPCDGEECERAYLYTGDAVRVAFSPATTGTGVAGGDEQRS